LPPVPPAIPGAMRLISIDDLKPRLEISRPDPLLVGGACDFERTRLHYGPLTRTLLRRPRAARTSTTPAAGSALSSYVVVLRLCERAPRPLPPALEIAP